MSRLFKCLLLLGSLAVTPLPVAASADVSRLSWLAGCWARDGAETGSVEHWLQPAGGSLLGLGRTVKAGKTIEHEFMQIRAASNGELAFTALPSGQSETTFTLLRLSDAEVVFENLAHDFPQRVIYRRDGDTRLLGRIEGMRKGVLRGVDFPMRRISCD